MSNESTSSGSIGVIGLLGVLFVGLKLGHIIDWSWIWVTFPFWGGFVLVFVALAVYLTCVALAAVVKRL